MSVIVTVSQTGGVGKTYLASAAVHAAATDLSQEYDAFVLAEANAVRSTLRVSLAPQALVDWPSAIRQHLPASQILQQVRPDWAGVSLLPGPSNPRDWVGLSYKAIRESIQQLVRDLPKDSWIHIDTGQIIDSPVHAASIAEAHLVIVLTTLSQPRVHAMEDWWRSLDRFREEQCSPERPLLTVAVALQRFEHENGTRRQLEKFLGSSVPVFPMAPHFGPEPFSDDSLPALAGQAGTDIRTITQHIHRALQEPARVA